MSFPLSVNHTIVYIAFPYASMCVLGVFILASFDRFQRQGGEVGFVTEYKQKLLSMVNGNRTYFIISMSLISLFCLFFVAPVVPVWSVIFCLCHCLCDVIYLLGSEMYNFLMPPESIEPEPRIQEPIIQEPEQKINNV